MWLWILATVVAYLVKGISGFASTLVFSSVLAFGINNINISPVDLALGFPPNIIMVWNKRKSLNFKVVGFLSFLILAGSLPGVFFLKNANVKSLKVVFGIVVAVIGLEMLLKELGILKMKQSKVLLVIIGLLSGLLCGMFGIGALLAAYVNGVAKSQDEFKANMCAVFIIDNIFRFIVYISMGIFTIESLKMFALLTPVMLISLYIGMRFSRFMNDKVVKKLVTVLLIFSGIMMVITNL